MKLNKIDLNWCVRRLPAELRRLMKKEEIVVAGGFVRACVAGEKINDVDVFTYGKEHAKEMAQHIADCYKKKPIKTDNAITIVCHPTPIQFITRWTYDSPVDVLSSFDFTVCAAAFWFDHYRQEWCSACTENFYQDLAAKRLQYTYPIRDEDAGGSILRVLKYYQRGYRITLDSFAGVISRVAAKVEYDRRIINSDGVVIDSEKLCRVITGLLYEVDPNVDPDHILHENPNAD